MKYLPVINKLAVLSIFPCFCVPSAYSQEAEEEKKLNSGDYLERIVVDAESSDQPVTTYDVEKQRLQATHNDLILNGDLARRHPDEHIGKALDRLPGLFATSPDEKDDIRIRGLDKQFSRVSVSGVEMPVVDRRRKFELGQFGSALAGEVRVIRNPTANIESDGIGGRVDADFREIPDVVSGGGFVSGDLFEGRFLGGRGGGWWGGPLNENWSIFGGMEIRNRPTELATNQRTVEADGSFKESEFRDDRKDAVSLTSVVRLRWQGDAGTAELQPILLYSVDNKTDTRFGTKANGDQDNRFKISDARTITAGAKFSWEQGQMPEDWSWHSHAAGFVARSTSDDSEIRRKFKGGTLDKLDETSNTPELTDYTYELGSHIAREWNGAIPGRSEFGVLARLRDREADSAPIKNGTPEDLKSGDALELDEQLLASWFRHEFRLLDERLTIEPGVRAEFYDLGVDTLADDGSPRSDDNDHVHFGPSLHLAYRPVDSLKLYAAVSRTLNRPQFDEITPFDQDPKKGEIKRGNTQLDPATSTNIDAGVLWAKPSYSLGVSVFHKDIEDLIIDSFTGEVVGGNDVIRPQNIESGTLRGIELEQRLNLSATGVSWLNGFSVWANQTVFDGEQTLNSGKKVPFFGQPDWLLRAGLDYTHPGSGLYVGLTLSHNSERTEDDGRKRNVFNPETYLNLAMSYPLSERATIRLEATNLTGENESGDKVTFADGSVRSEVEEVARQFSVGLHYEF